jgi:hypothetical protein
MKTSLALANNQALLIVTATFIPKTAEPFIL